MTVGFAGNKEDGFAKLMAEVEAENVVEAVVETPIVPVETLVDEVVIQDSPVAVVAPQPVIETPVLRQEQPQTDKPAEDFEQKFKTLQGMHQADRERDKNLNATLQAQLDAEVTARVDAERQLAEVPLDYQEIMGSEAYDDLGEGTVDGIAKLLQAERIKAEAASNLKMAALQSTITDLQNGVLQKEEDEVAYKNENATNQHDQRVLAEVPEFLALMKDTAFTTWLNDEVDTISGQSMYTVFSDADNAMNSDYVANICKLYLGSKAVKDANAYDKSEHVAPTMNSITPSDPIKPIMFWKDYNTIADRFMNQKCSEQEYTLFNNAFEQAKLDGRVQ